MSETVEAVRKMSPAVLAGGTGVGVQEIYWLLFREGLVDGHPGAWKLTEKALAYGSARLDWNHNNSWQLITFDPAVLDVLDLSDAGKEWARQQVKDWRMAKKVAREAADA